MTASLHTVTVIWGKLFHTARSLWLLQHHSLCLMLLGRMPAGTYSETGVLRLLHMDTYCQSYMYHVTTWSWKPSQVNWFETVKSSALSTILAPWLCEDTVARHKHSWVHVCYYVIYYPYALWTPNAITAVFIFLPPWPWKISQGHQGHIPILYVELSGMCICLLQWIKMTPGSKIYWSDWMVQHVWI